MSAPGPFSAKLVVGIVAAGVLAFALMLVGIAYGGIGDGRQDGRAHALAVSATGFKGLVSLVGSFHETRLVRRTDSLAGDNLLVVALEPMVSRPEDLARLLDQRHGRATLIILPKWVTMPDPARRGWVRAVSPDAGALAGAMIGKDVLVDVERAAGTGESYASGDDILYGLSVPVPRAAQVVSGSDLVPLVSYGNGALVARLGPQPHFVVADPDLLNNHGLRRPEAARAALALITSLNATGARGVDFDLTVNGMGERSGASLLRIAFEPPFLAMTLALFAAALIAGLHGAFRFGPLRRPERAIAFGKAALVENAAGLIRLAGRETRLGPAYAEMVRQDAARLTGAPPGLEGDALDHYLDRLNRRVRFSDLAAALRTTSDRSGLLAAAQALFQWRKEVIR